MPSTTPLLSLVVIRTTDLDAAAVFYRALGLVFDRHRHGTGPEHLASVLASGAVFEVYPRRNETDSTTAVRLGFGVPDLEEAIARVAVVPDARLITPPADSPWGRRAVLKDPDNHTVELVEIDAGLGAEPSAAH